MAQQDGTTPVVNDHGNEDQHDGDVPTGNLDNEGSVREDMDLDRNDDEPDGSRGRKRRYNSNRIHKNLKRLQSIPGASSVPHYSGLLPADGFSTLRDNSVATIFAVNQRCFWAGCEDDETRSAYLATLLVGEAQKRYQDLCNTLNTTNPPYAAVKEILNDSSQHTEKSQLEWHEEAERANLLDIAWPRKLALSAAMSELKRICDQRKGVDQVTRIRWYLKALPPAIKRQVEKKNVNGVLFEWKDPQELYTSICSFSATFKELLDNYKKPAPSSPVSPHSNHHAHQKKQKFSHGSGSGSKPASVKPAGPSNKPSASVKSEKKAPANRPIKEPPVPQSDRSWDYKKGMHSYVEGMTKGLRASLIKANKCVLCQESGHHLDKCPERKSRFEAGTYFAYKPLSKE